MRERREGAGGCQGRRLHCLQTMQLRCSTGSDAQKTALLVATVPLWHRRLQATPPSAPSTAQWAGGAPQTAALSCSSPTAMSSSPTTSCSTRQATSPRCAAVDVEACAAFAACVRAGRLFGVRSARPQWLPLAGMPSTLRRCRHCHCRLLLQYQHLQVDNPTASNSRRLPATVHSDTNLTIRCPSGATWHQLSSLGG